MKLIKLHASNSNKPIWVNPNYICSVSDSPAGRKESLITFIGENDGYFRVLETPEELVKLLEE